MARRQRPYSVITQQAAVDLGDATAETLLTMRPPSPGAVLEGGYVVITTAGTGTGTHTVSIEDDTNDVTATGFVSVDADATAGTIYEIPGIAYSFSTGGEGIAVQNTEVGTISDGAIVCITLWWQT